MIINENFSIDLPFTFKCFIYIVFIACLWRLLCLCILYSEGYSEIWILRFFDVNFKIIQKSIISKWVAEAIWLSGT